MHQFLARYTPSFEELNEANAHLAVKILQSWTESHSVDFSDYESCLEALGLQQTLGLKGRIFYASGQPAGFILEKGSIRKCFDMRFAKAIVAYKGVYQYMYQTFAQTLKAPIEWLNFETDLGIPALAHAKTAYHPDRFGIKYRITKKS